MSLIRTCGGEIHGLAQFRNDDNLLASKNSSKEHFQQSHFPLDDSYSSGLTSSVSFSFDNSLHSFWSTPRMELLHLFSEAGIMLTYVSPPFGAEHGDTHGTSNVEYLGAFCTFSSPVIKSSSESQYDPLVDSIGPPKVGILTSVSPRVIMNTMSSQHVLGDHILGYIASEGIIVDKGEDVKESKAVKIFHTALVDFVKELLKTIWKEGHSSRDAHKMIVKKAAEKVLNALQPHHVPIDRVDKGSSFGIQTKSLKGYGGASLSLDSISSVSDGEISSWFLLQLSPEHELLSAAAAAAANSNSGLNPATIRAFCFGASSISKFHAYYYSLPCNFCCSICNFHFFSHLFCSR
ncbi:unnamed protein product [Musa acuminata subsp. malaccensis]|uniref:(wild Malaysian banana) hypothetical protein n=1 Tax=Musa acuminata subsp. malaccensis TaxID=214687 RepID=A0A804JBM4_MUSAM|nr:unnamed protein product [Musa acuminata subsp. malaccensis]